MFQSPPRESEWLSWLFAGLWSLVLFVAIPFARMIQRDVASLFGGRELFVVAVLAVVIASAVGVALYVIHRRGRRAWVSLLYLAGVGAAYCWCASQWTSSAVEALHFLEYGVLGLLLYRALVHRVRDSSVYLSAVLVGAFVGVLDETLQWLTPARVFDLRDAGFNVLSVGLMQVAIAGGLRPSIVAGRMAPGSIRLACRFGAALLVLVGLCLANTPARVAWCSQVVPGLGFLRGHENVMTEYGFRHVEPEIGTFFSRLRRDELKREDETRGKEAAELLEPWRPHGKYPEFLRTCRPEVDPFVHEFRVHAFCRDHHMGILRLERSENMGEGEKRAHATTAYREYQILQMCFSNTLANSHYKLDPSRLEWLGQQLDSVRYVSPVSRHLITRLSENQLRLILGVLIVALAGTDIWLGRHVRP